MKIILEKIKTLNIKQKVFIALGFLFLLLLSFTLIVQPKNFGGGNISPTEIPLTPLFVGQKNKNQVSPLQRSIIGQQVDEKTLKSVPGFLNETRLSGNTFSYSYKSEINMRPSEVIVKDKTAVFEKIVVPTNPKTRGYALISQFIATYGPPEKEFQGSKTYEFVGTHYIYARKGFAFVGNRFTDEIFEIYTFNSMSVEEYIKIYGEDITEDAVYPVDEM